MISFKKIGLISSFALLPFLNSCGNGETITSLKIDGETTLEVDKTYVFKVITDKNTPNLDLVWSTSNKFISKIDSKTGEFKASETGNVTIKVVDNISKIESSLDLTIIEGKEDIDTSAKFFSFVENFSMPLEKEMKSITYTKSFDNGSNVKYDDKYTFYHYSDNSSIQKNVFSGKTASSKEEYTENIDTLKYIENDKYFEITNRDVRNSYMFIYDVSDTESGYGILSTEQAESKVNEPSYIDKLFAVDLDNMRTFTEETFSSRIEGESLIVTGSSYYLQTYPNAEDSDICEYYSYEVEAKFKSSGELLNLEYTSKEYRDKPYDFDKEELKPTAKANNVTTISYEASVGELLDPSEKLLDKNDYFVQSIEQATYNQNNTLKVNDTIAINKLAISSFSPSTAIDVTSEFYTIVSDDEDNFPIVKQADGTYKGVTTGSEVVTFKNKNSNVTFNIKIEVV